MFRRTVLLAGLWAGTLGLAGCTDREVGGTDSSDAGPGAVARRFYEALAAGDVDGVLAVVDPNGTLAERYEGLTEAEFREATADVTFERVEVRAVEVDGDEATVDVDLTPGDADAVARERRMLLRRDGDEWLVSYESRRSTSHLDAPGSEDAPQTTWDVPTENSSDGTTDGGFDGVQPLDPNRTTGLQNYTELCASEDVICEDQ